jgi:hypothetical protein
MPAEPQHPAAPTWFKSSHSGGNTTECVEAAFVTSGVLIRDSKRTESPHLMVTAATWSLFVAGTQRIPADH